MQAQVLKVFEKLSTAENWYQIDGSGDVDEVRFIQAERHRQLRTIFHS